MWRLSFRSIRYHRGGFAGVFIAIFLAATLITALGVLFESGLRGGIAPARYAAADVVVGAPQELAIKGDTAEPLTERALLPGTTTAKVAAVPGVEHAIADYSVPLTTSAHKVVDAHGWASAVLTPYTLASGTTPSSPSDVVVDSSFGITNGAQIKLAHGGVFEEYTVVGTVTSAADKAATDAPATVFFSDERELQLWPHKDSVATIGVIAKPGTDADALAAAITTAVPEAKAYTGSLRGEVESLASVGARSQLTALSSSFAGVSLLIALFVVASTLSLSTSQRRKEFALLRAVGALPGQIQAIIAREVLLVSATAAVLGVVPGLFLAEFLRAQFVTGHIIPADFTLAYSIYPAIIAVATSVVTALGAATMAARRSANIAPVDALRESAVETPALGAKRKITGLLFLAGGVVAAIIPLFVSGMFGLTGAAGAALLLIVGVGILGPWIVEHALRIVSPLLRRSSSASVVLADANARGYTRRLAAAIVPLALAISFSCVQLFLPTTVAAEAVSQQAQGVTADYLVASQGSGLSPALEQQVAQLPGVTAVNPVIRSSATITTHLIEEDSITQSYALQGINPAALTRTLDLSQKSGSLADLAQPNTVALSTTAAATSGVKVGEPLTFTLGDGTPVTATVVATYAKGLGFGDLTMSVDALRPHTTTTLDDYLLVSASAEAKSTVGKDISALGLVIQPKDGVATAGSAERDAQSWVSLIALGVIFGYIALSVVNTLVMATSQRRQEFNLLRLIGATNHQVQKMTFVESALIATISVLVGTAVAVLPLIGIAFGVSGQPLPTVPPTVYGGIVAFTVLLGLVSIAIPTRRAIRSAPRPN